MPEGPEGQAAVPAVPEGPAGLAAVPVGGGAWPDNESTRRATDHRRGPTGVEGAGGICRGAGGRRQGQN